MSLPFPKLVEHRKLIQSRMCYFCDLIYMTLGIATGLLSTLMFVISLAGV
jgi:hypothetical protein